MVHSVEREEKNEKNRDENQTGVISISGNALFENRIATEQSVSLEKLRWLTSFEAAQYLRVSIGSIKNMVYRGQLRPKKIGRRNRFLREDLERVIRFS